MKHTWSILYYITNTDSKCNHQCKPDYGTQNDLP